MSFPELPGWKGPSETGREAALAYAEQAKGRRRQVIIGLLDHGSSTAEQIGERIGLHWYLVRPRLAELRTLGLVTDSGMRGRGALGGRVIVWRLTTPEEKAAIEAARAAKEAGGASQ